MTDILARQRQLIGTTAEWGADDLVLGNGEMAVERVSATEIKVKIGDGVSRFSTLPYVAGGTTGGGAPITSAGGTMTGPLVLPAGVPTGLQAMPRDEADKLYVLVSKLIAASAGAASADSVPKLNAAGKIDASFLSIAGGMTFKGTIDPTAAAPATPAVGDYYFAKKSATLGATWTGLVGTTIKVNDSLMFDGTNWHSGPAVADLASFVSKAGDTMTGKLVVPEVAVSGGKIDGTAIGSTTPAAGAFTTVNATGSGTFGTTAVNSFVSIKSTVASGGAGSSEVLFGNATTATSGYLSYSHATTSLLIGAAAATRATLSATGLAVAGVIEGAEQIAPAAPPANGYRIYAEDNGTGKTRLMAKFATGVAQQLAIESASAGGTSTPVGVIMDFAGSVIPTDWLDCNGQEILRAAYPALFTAIGTTWGAGNGTTTFNVPDMRRRVAVGSGGTPTATLSAGVGAVGGAETHLLTAAESGMPAHLHGTNGTGSASLSPGIHAYASSLSGSTGVFYDCVQNAVPQNAAQAHNNMQPSAVVLKIIKAF